MLTIKVVWALLKKYFFMITLILGFVLGIILMLVAGKQPSIDWQKRMDDLNKKHVEEIERIRAEESRKVQELVKKYELTMKDIERQYVEKQQALEESKKQEIEDLIVQYGNDPKKVTAELANALPGIVVKMPEEFE